MRIFTVRAIKPASVTLESATERFDLPKSLFAAEPVAGETVCLQLDRLSTDKPLPNESAQALLNHLLSFPA